MTVAPVPITAFYAGLCAILLVVLIYRVIKLRRGLQIGIGDGGEEELSRAIRAHGNFVETVPLGLVLVLLSEMNGIQIGLVHMLGVMLIIGRCAHAWGLTHNSGTSVGRFAGMLLTLIMLLLGAATALYSYASIVGGVW